LWGFKQQQQQQQSLKLLIVKTVLYAPLTVRDPVRTKIVIDNKIIEQVNSFNYLGNTISYGKELDIDNTLQNYLKITGIINNVFRPQKKPLRKQE
jgi:hypothetical protein